MIRLAIATVVLLVALVVVKRRQHRSTGGDGLRITSRTGISRGVLAAVLEVEERRFLVTITATSTTLVAELGAGDAAGVVLSPAVTPDLPPPSTTTLAALVGPVPPVDEPVLATATPAAAGAEATFLERIRARTVRSYDSALAGRADAGA